MNGSIGAQWTKKNLADILGRGVNDALVRSGLPDELLGDVRMNVVIRLTDKA